MSWPRPHWAITGSLQSIPSDPVAPEHLKNSDAMQSIRPHAPRLVRPPVYLRLRDTQPAPAPLLARLAGAVLDGLLTAGSALPALGLCWSAELTGPSATFIAGVCVFLFMVIQWFLVASTGQSLGKRWVGTRIVRDDGRPVDFVHGVVLRSWVIGGMLGVPLVGGIVALVDHLVIFGHDRRCIHDHLAGTRVIRD